MFPMSKIQFSLNIFGVFSICPWSFLEYTKKVLALVLSWSKVFPRFWNPLTILFPYGKKIISKINKVIIAIYVCLFVWSRDQALRQRYRLVVTDRTRVIWFCLNWTEIVKESSIYKSKPHRTRKYTQMEAFNS